MGSVSNQTPEAVLATLVWYFTIPLPHMSINHSRTISLSSVGQPGTLPYSTLPLLVHYTIQKQRTMLTNNTGNTSLANTKSSIELLCLETLLVATAQTPVNTSIQFLQVWHKFTTELEGCPPKMKWRRPSKTAQDTLWSFEWEQRNYVEQKKGINSRNIMCFSTFLALTTNDHVACG